MAKPWQLPTMETHGRRASEWEEQCDFVRWFRKTYPSVLIFHIPNGDLRSKRDGARLKAAGVVPGIPDLFIPSWRLWIEMKVADVPGEARGVVSKEQEERIGQLERAGYTVRICRGSEAAKAAVCLFLEGVA